MAEFPALPLFTDAYLGDTRHLTAAQHGAYLLLLMMAWRQPDCAIPNDDKILSRWSSMDLRSWKSNREIILSFWRLGEDQKWRQHRLLDERKHVEHVRSINAAAGKSSALKRLNRGSTTVPTEVQRTVNPLPIPIPNKEITPIGVTKKTPLNGTRLDQKWELSEDLGNWALTQGMKREEVLSEEQKFLDYWTAKAGSQAVKRDWDATWRNWVRQSLERKAQKGFK